MENDHDDFAEWRGSIEYRVGTLEKSVAIQARVRAQMDQDMSELKLEFRAQRGLLQALHDTQQEHTAMLREHGESLVRLQNALGGLKTDVGGLKTDVGGLQAGQAKLEAGLATVLGGVQTIIGLLDRDIAARVAEQPDENPAAPE
jgi:hypothetical protein